MSGDFQRTRSVMTRSAHVCEWCRTGIPLSTTVAYVSGKDDGVFVHWYFHADCWEAIGRDPCCVDGEGCIYLHDRGKTCDEMGDEPPVRY